MTEVAQVVHHLTVDLNVTGSSALRSLPTSKNLIRELIGYLYNLRISEALMASVSSLLESSSKASII